MIIEQLNQIRYVTFYTHAKVIKAVRELLTVKVLARLGLTVFLLGATNWSSFRRGWVVQSEVNWNGGDYVKPSAEAVEAMQKLAEDGNAVVEVFAINYRTPGHYEGIWRSGGDSNAVPLDRYAGRDVQWSEMQRSECGVVPIEVAEAGQSFEIFCPLLYSTLSLPVGFVVVRWAEDRPSKGNLWIWKDRLWDVGRLVSR